MSKFITTASNWLYNSNTNYVLNYEKAFNQMKNAKACATPLNFTLHLG